MKLITQMQVDEIARVSKAQDPTGETVRVKLRATQGAQTLNLYMDRSETKGLALGQTVVMTFDARPVEDEVEKFVQGGTNIFAERS